MSHPAVRTLVPLLLGIGATVLAGCGGDEPAKSAGAVAERGWPKGWPADGERVWKEGDAPTPYTAAQIREGCAPGREDVVHVVDKGESSWLHLRFTGGTETLAEFEVARTTSAQDPAPAWKPVKAPWSALQGHASSPADKTVVTFERVEVGAGAFDAAVYTISGVADGKPQVTRHWFAVSLPGQPVKTVITVGGETVSTREMIRTTRSR